MHRILPQHDPIPNRSLNQTVAIARKPLITGIMGRSVIEKWVNGSVNPPAFLLLSLGIWTVESTVDNSVALMLNAANELRF